MPPSKKLIVPGDRFDKLKVVRRDGVHPTRHGLLWLCECKCGNTKTVEGRLLRDGTTTSCGCVRAQNAKTHGKSNSPEYRSWVGMRRRCYDEKHEAYGDYGGRGITVCDRWRESFELFFVDMGPRPKGTTLERRNNNLGYSSDNCYWATSKQQNLNKRNNRLVEFRAVTKTVSEWADELRIGRQTLLRRLDAGWTVEDALTMPVERGSSYRDRIEAA